MNQIIDQSLSQKFYTTQEPSNNKHKVLEKNLELIDWLSCSGVLTLLATHIILVNFYLYLYNFVL